MSRIIVKNLPKSITEEKLRQIFSEKGLLTDVQLKYTADGKFRQFAFLGYQNEYEAQEAIKHFNNTCIQTKKIIVLPCALLGDETKPKSWSKYAPDSNVHKKNKANISNNNSAKDIEKVVKNKTKDLLDKYKDDPLFEEFLEVHKVPVDQLLDNKPKNEKLSSRDKSKQYEEKSDSGVSDAESIPAESEKPTEMTDLEYMKMIIKNSSGKPRQKMAKKIKEKINLFTLKLRNLHCKCKKKEIKQFFSPNIPFSIRIPRNIKGIAYVGFKNEKQFKKALLKDKSIMMGKKIQVCEYRLPDSAENKDDIINQKKEKWKTQEERLKNEEDIAESGRIFFRNLSYTTKEDDVQNLFAKFGPLAEINLLIDTTTRIVKGFGTVTFVMPEHAVKAYSELDGSILHGRMLHLLPALSKESNQQSLDDESSSYKQKKESKQKAEAGLSHNWNSLFLGHDAVADVIADTFGTTKKAVLDPHGSSSAAVRLALGETQIVRDTRKCLEQEGVILDAFNGVITKRSKTVILVKNLPANTQKKELADLFKPHGFIDRIILSPGGVTALIEFMEPFEAKKAFTRLAYTKFKNLPLYLEWAPENCLMVRNETPLKNEEIEQKSETASSKNLNKDTVNTEESNLNQEESDNEQESPEPNTTLFVKNLNFATTDEDLRKHFESCGKIYYATVATKKDKIDSAKRLSMGYGFVQFMYKSGIDKALKTLQQSTLDGKSIELKRSERTLANEVTSTRKSAKKTKQTGTKILVRNVPFQATLKEIQELFKAFGEIKAIRLPKKMATDSSSHRGFAFVDFVAASDAKKAFEQLSQSTHLYGRRLVLEWAATEEGVDQIRKRTADHFHTTDEVKSKKSVFNIE